MTTVLGLVSRNGRDGHGRFPSGWTAGGVDNSFFGGQLPSAGDLAVRTSGDDVSVTVPLAAGGFGILRGSGPADTEGELEVEAHTEGEAIVGSVRNGLPFAVEDVGAILGRDSEQIGRIEPGETVEFRFEGRELSQRDPYTPAEAALWPAEAGYGANPSYDSVVNLALWNDAHLAIGPNARTRGVVTVVGWTRAYEGPAEAQGQAAANGRSAIVGRGPVTAPDGAVAPGSAHREYVRGPNGIELPDADVPARLGGALWRFALPSGAGSQGLRLDVPAYLARADVWNGSAWIAVDDHLDEAGNFTGDIAQVRTVDLPADAVVDGIVWVRGWMLVDFGGFDGVGLDVRDAEEQS